jgi:hypothetical protein
MSKDKPTIDNARSIGHDFGHVVYIDADEFTVTDDGNHYYQNWRYADTNELIDEAPRRACPHCNLMETEDGHDPCIANLEGVEFACCGHGDLEFGSPYVVFINDAELVKDKVILRDEEALEYFKSVGRMGEKI